MGQLDEAIRAHLDLKRKHGASEEELHAEEQEALGPVRREAPSQEAPETALDLEDEPDLRDELSLDEPLEDLPPEAFHEPADPRSDAFDYTEPLPPADLADPADLTEPLEPEPAAGETPPRGFEAVQDPVEEDDVLEETPDFLQETPEHDRLWFEQKPPRDFDFDDE
jgi:hypothetical protein